MSFTKNPVIVYVDDQPQNLVVFEMSLPENWIVKTFDNAADCLEKLVEIDPWVTISDQKMPKITGKDFLQRASELVPNARRIVTTGQTDEQTMISLVRDAQISDYITKPWQAEELETRILTAIQYYEMQMQRDDAHNNLKVKNTELVASNSKLQELTKQLELSASREMELRKDIEAWASAPIVRAVKDKTMNFPTRRDIVGLTYDIINSSTFLDSHHEGSTIRAHVRRLFLNEGIKYGVLRESNNGDSCYVHFGAVDGNGNNFESALFVANNFFEKLEEFRKTSGLQVDCGIAIHFMPDTLVRVNVFSAHFRNELVIQKDFDTESFHVDFLHRTEKLVHDLPGSNIIVSDDFIASLPSVPENIIRLGFYQAKGTNRKVLLYLLPSDKLKNEDLNNFIKKYFTEIGTVSVA